MPLQNRTLPETQEAPDETPDTPAQNPSILRLIALTALGATLVWLILTRSLAASLAETAPETALSLQPREPRALLTLAKAQWNALIKLPEEKPAGTDPKVTAPPDPRGRPAPNSDRLANLSRLAEAALGTPNRSEQNGQQLQPQQLSPTPSTEAAAPGTGGDPDKADAIRALAEQTLAADPFNADALGLLGQLAEREGDVARTEALMRAAAHLSIRESYAVYWLLQKAQRENNRAAVLRQADTLLRTRGRAVPLAVPILAQVAEKGAPTDVIALLKTNPPWRGAFFGRLPQNITDARTPLYLLLGLQGTAHPPTQQELAQYINFLIGRQFHELAYYTWLQFLPTEDLAKITPLFNPSFEKPLTGLPFDWALAQGSGVTSEIRPRPAPSDDPDNAQALFVEFTQGRAEFPGVRQLTLLGPGTYELKGKYKGMLVGKRGLIWRVSCTGKGPLAESELLRGDISQWRDFAVQFTVPPTGCRAQQIRLELDARSASERLITGSMWFDELDLKRQSN
jgi:hypothetical protein